MMSATMSITAGPKVPACASRAQNKRVVAMAPTMKNSMATTPIISSKAASMAKKSERCLSQKVFAVADGTVLDRPLRVAVIGGGPSGACAAETLAKGGVETYLLERKMDNCKVC